MGRFDAEMKQATAIAAMYDRFMPLVEKNAADSTAELRAFIAKVQKHQQRLAEVANHAQDRIKYISGVERSVDLLEASLAKAERMSDHDAEEVLKKKSLGNLVSYDYDKGKPAKPQLVKAIKDAIESEVKRGHGLVAAQQQSREAWEKSAKKHMAWCEKAKQAVAGAALD